MSANWKRISLIQSAYLKEMKCGKVKRSAASRLKPCPSVPAIKLNGLSGCPICPMSERPRPAWPTRGRHLKSGGNSWSLPIGLPVNLCHVQFVAGVIGRFWTRFTSSVRDAAAVFSECLGSAVMKPCSRSVFAVQPQCDAMNLPCACSGSAVLMQHFAWRGCWQLAIRHFALLLLPSPGLACPETHCTHHPINAEWNIKGYCVAGLFLGVFRCRTRLRSVLHFVETCCVRRTRPQHR